MTMPGSDPKPSFLESISPWSTSRNTPPQADPPENIAQTESLKQTSGQDHVTSYKKRLSSLRYPSDCPTLQTRWFYAVDTPKSKPAFSSLEKTEPEPKHLPPAKKFIPFSPKDSQAARASQFENELSISRAALVLLASLAASSQ